MPARERGHDVEVTPVTARFKSRAPNHLQTNRSLDPDLNPCFTHGHVFVTLTTTSKQHATQTCPAAPSVTRAASVTAIRG